MAIFDAMNYANSDAYIKSNLLYMNIFTGKSESSDNLDADYNFLANMTLYLSECKNVITSIKSAITNSSITLPELTENMKRYILTNDDTHAFLAINESDIKVFCALKSFIKSIKSGDALFNKEVEHLLDYSNATLDKEVLPTMKDKITCMKNSISNYYSASSGEDKYGKIRNDLSKGELISTINYTRTLIADMKEELLKKIDAFLFFIETLTEKYNSMSNEDLMEFKLSAIYVNITLGMQLKILSHSLDKYFNYAKTYNTRFDILKGEC